MNQTEPVRRQRNAARTKALILAAARHAFASHGYNESSIRAIAQEAGVAPSLLIRHFGSKPALFREALLHAMYDEDYADLFTAAGKDGFGERIIALAQDVSDDVTAMVVLSIGDPAAREVTSDVAREHIVGGLALWLGPPDAYARALNMVMLLNGYMLFGKQLAMGETPRSTLDWIAQQLQAIVDEGEGRPGYRP